MSSQCCFKLDSKCMCFRQRRLHESYLHRRRSLMRYSTQLRCNLTIVTSATTATDRLYSESSHHDDVNDGGQYAAGGSRISPGRRCQYEHPSRSSFHHRQEVSAAPSVQSIWQEAASLNVTPRGCQRTPSILTLN